MAKTTIPELPVRAGFLRRIASLGCDMLTIIILESLVTLLSLAIAWGLSSAGLVNTSAGLDHYISQQEWYSTLVWVALLGYFIYFWMRSGQTLGMKLLKIKVRSLNGNRLTLTQALIRLFTAALGLGNFVVLLDNTQRLAFQDHWAKCEVIVID